MKLTFAVLAAFICYNSNAFAALGKEGGGGKEIELEFAEIAYLFTDALTRQPKEFSDFADLDVNAFLYAQANTEVYAVDTLCTTIQDSATGNKGLRCLDAEYLPETNQIRFSIESWKGKTCIRKMGIVVHELGRAAGIENGNYKYSARVSRNPMLRTACLQYDNDMKSRIKE